MRFGIVVVAFAAALFAAPPSHAILGEPAEEAADRAESWSFRFGAYYPKIDSDAEGLAIRECWLADDSGWSEARALQFAGMLLPAAVRGEVPRRVDARNGYIHYVLPSGYAIDLRTSGVVPPRIGPGGIPQVRVGTQVIRVVVRAPGVEGSSCSGG